MALEVADDAVHLDPRILLGDRRRRLPKSLLGHVERHESPEVSGLDHRVEQEARLLGRPEPGSTSVFAAVSVATSSARSARMIRSRLVR